MLKAYSIFNPPPCEGTFNKEPSLCQRQFAASCDINALIRRFIGGDTSVIVKRNPPSEQDLRNLPADRFEAELIMARGRSIWEGLPIAVRQTYGNAEAFLKAYSAELEKQAREASDNPPVDDGKKKPETTKTTEITETPKTSPVKAE